MLIQRKCSRSWVYIAKVYAGEFFTWEENHLPLRRLILAVSSCWKPRSMFLLIKTKWLLKLKSSKWKNVVWTFFSRLLLRWRSVYPLRNASLVTAVKTKQRNRMGLELLNAIIRICSKLQFSDSCCINFKVTKPMLELFNAKKMYDCEEDKD